MINALLDQNVLLDEVFIIILEEYSFTVVLVHIISIISIISFASELVNYNIVLAVYIHQIFIENLKLKSASNPINS